MDNFSNIGCENHFNDVSEFISTCVGAFHRSPPLISYKALVGLIENAYVQSKNDPDAIARIHNSVAFAYAGRLVLDYSIAKVRSNLIEDALEKTIFLAVLEALQCRLCPKTVLQQPLDQLVTDWVRDRYTKEGELCTADYELHSAWRAFHIAMMAAEAEFKSRMDSHVPRSPGRARTAVRPVALWPAAFETSRATSSTTTNALATTRAPVSAVETAKHAVIASAAVHTTRSKTELCKLPRVSARPLADGAIPRGDHVRSGDRVRTGDHVRASCLNAADFSGTKNNVWTPLGDLWPWGAQVHSNL